MRPRNVVKEIKLNAHKIRMGCKSLERQKANMNVEGRTRKKEKKENVHPRGKQKAGKRELCRLWTLGTMPSVFPAWLSNKEIVNESNVGATIPKHCRVATLRPTHNSIA